MIETSEAAPGVIATRNGVPPDSWLASDPPGGVPRHPDPDPRPHVEPSEGGLRDAPDPPPVNEPPKTPPTHQAKASVQVTRTTHVQVSRSPQRHK